MSSQSLTVTIDMVQETDYSLWLPHWRDYQTFYKVALSEATTQATWRRFSMTKNPFIAPSQERAKTYSVLCTMFSIVLLGPKRIIVILKTCLLPQRQGGNMLENN